MLELLLEHWSELDQMPYLTESFVARLVWTTVGTNAGCKSTALATHCATDALK